jgi:hypothetical protein
MAGYRLYFLDEAQRITAREEFEADSDENAVAIAHQRYNANSDVYSGFELWCGARRLVPAQLDEGLTIACR